MYVRRHCVLMTFSSIFFNGCFSCNPPQGKSILLALAKSLVLQCTLASFWVQQI